MKSAKDLMVEFDWDNPVPYRIEPEINFTSENVVEEDYDTELNKILELAGVNKGAGEETLENLSLAGNEKAKIQKEKGIEPGTDEWFKLWFSRPKLTGEKPYDES